MDEQQEGRCIHPWAVVLDREAASGPVPQGATLKSRRWRSEIPETSDSRDVWEHPTARARRVQKLQLTLLVKYFLWA